MIFPGTDGPALQGIGSFIAGVSTLFGGVAGWVVGHRRHASLAATARAAEDAAQIDAVTRRFEVLLSGYEQRIQDLTAEVHSLRAEVVSLRSALDNRSKHVVSRQVP